MVKKLLVIDDDVCVSEIVQLCLEYFEGWQVSTSCSGDALETARSEDWNALLLEVALQGIDGIDLVEQLQADPTTQRVPIVVLTSRVMPREMAHYRRLNIAGVVAKPFDVKTLGSEIAHLLRWSPPWVEPPKAMVGAIAV